MLHEHRSALHRARKHFSRCKVRRSIVVGMFIATMLPASLLGQKVAPHATVPQRAVRRDIPLHEHDSPRHSPPARATRADAPAATTGSCGPSTRSTRGSSHDIDAHGPRVDRAPQQQRLRDARRSRCASTRTSTRQRAARAVGAREITSGMRITRLSVNGSNAELNEEPASCVPVGGRGGARTAPSLTARS